MTKQFATGSLLSILHDARIIPELTDLLAVNQTCYLVGGALRNARLGLPVADFDFTLAGDPTILAREFSQRLGGHWFSLDETRRQSRVVIKTDEGAVSYDFAPLRAATLEVDLQLRDYTINAMALPMRRGAERQELIDPLGGRADLAGRRLRCCSGSVLQDDPLRVLKGVRHCVALDLQPEAETFVKMAEAGAHLLHSAPERIRAELGQIFSESLIGGRFDLFGRLGLADVLFDAPGASGSFAAGCKTLQRLESWMQRLAEFDTNESILELFDDVVEQYWPRRALLKLAAFLIGYQARNLDMLARDRLRLGRQATALLTGFARLSARRYAEIADLVGAPRGRALWVESLAPGRGEALVLLAALAAADPGGEGRPLFDLLSDYLAIADARGRISDLVGGDWLRDELGVFDGPRIGELLKTLRIAEVDGRVANAEDARTFLRNQSAK